MFTMEFSTSNAAFDNWPGDEIARILVDVGENAKDGRRGGEIRDSNGNRIGSWSWPSF